MLEAPPSTRAHRISPKGFPDIESKNAELEHDLNTLQQERLGMSDWFAHLERVKAQAKQRELEIVTKMQDKFKVIDEAERWHGIRPSSWNSKRVRKWKNGTSGSSWPLRDRKKALWQRPSGEWTVHRRGNTKMTVGPDGRSA
ncbi:hypothetical protein PsorP6_017583 [Peronosclerospora sorghi]|uniref:Uncharacterized protein n=1 Tax=Peronosclerospora sorghi TaxID=230839 RepID=A0ACC0WK86_9STRA|nr:hypothetical protein PsorP6_017583 [Peronosclerospora sorghi]